MRLAILLASASSWFLVGLGVTVGLVTYPGFKLVGEGEWKAFHNHHSQKIAWAVGFPWVAQATGLIWWFFRGGSSSALWWITGTTAAMAVAATAFSAVGLHSRLANDKQSRTLFELNRVHSVRILLWIIAAISTSLALR